MRDGIPNLDSMRDHVADWLTFSSGYYYQHRENRCTNVPSVKPVQGGRSIRNHQLYEAPHSEPRLRALSIRHTSYVHVLVYIQYTNLLR